MRALIIIMAAGFGCVSKSAQAAGETRPVGAAVEPSSPRAPFVVEWVPQGEVGARVTLVARVNRHIPFRVPIAVTVTIPAGLRIVSGRTNWIIDPSDSVGPVEEVVVVEVVEAGPQEMILAADVEGTGFGVHAKRSYVIGSVPARSATRASTPAGPHLEVGGHDFGPSVPAK